MNWHTLKVEKVNEIIALNKKGKTVASLEEFIEDVSVSNEKLFSDAVGQDSLTRFDKPKRSKSSRRKKSKRSRNKQGNKSNTKNTAKKSSNSKGGNSNKKRRPKQKPKNNA